MEGDSNLKPAEWMLLSIHSPGRDAVSGGILLIDHATNRLHVEIRRDFSHIDEDTREVLNCLAEDLEETAAVLGARHVVAQCEENWSHTFRLSRRHAFRLRNPSEAIQRVFQREVINQNTFDEVALFTPQQLSDARASIPFSPAVALKALTALRDPSTSFSAIEAIVSQDVSISAQLVRLANSALHSRGVQVRSISQALVRLGTDLAKWHVTTLMIRRAYSSPPLRKVWNHSVEVARIARRICRQVPSLPEQEVTLAALVHDIGQLCLLSLGEQFISKSAELQGNGDYVVEIERRLCGISHAEIGAALLEDWKFPADIAAAVRNHHAPQLSETAISDVVFLAEDLSFNDEDLSDSHWSSKVIERLGIDGNKLRSAEQQHLESDLDQSRFSATA